MDSLNDRKKAFEKKFAHDAEMIFKAEARRNRTLAEWIGEKWGMTSDEAEKSKRSEECGGRLRNISEAISEVPECRVCEAAVSKVAGVIFNDGTIVICYFRISPCIGPKTDSLLEL